MHGFQTNPDATIPSKDRFAVFISTNYENKSLSERYCCYDGSNNIFLNHKTPYGIGIFNGSDGEANAIIFIGSEIIGKFRVESNKSVIIKRSIKIARNFTFVSQYGNIACQNEKQMYNDTSIVKVIIQPEDMSIPVKSYFVNQYDMTRNLHRTTPLASLDTSFDNYDFSQNKNKMYHERCDKYDTACNDSCPDMTDIGRPRGMAVETDGFHKKNDGITVLGDFVNQDFIPEKFPLQTRGQHMFILHLTIGNPSENNIFMLDTDAESYNAI